MSRGRWARLLHLDRFGLKMEESVDEEVRFHLETRIQELMAKGLSPEEARSEVLARFGNPERIADRCLRIDKRTARKRALNEMVADAAKDLRHALRALWKAKGYSAVTILSLAAGIGINSALLTAISDIWVAPVPGVSGQDRIIDPVIVQDGADWWGWTYPDFQAVWEASTPLEAVMAWTEGDATLGMEDGAGRVQIAYASQEYFRVLGAAPPLGRGFGPAESGGPGQNPVVVISHSMWRDVFGARDDILGEAITVNREPYTVIGVAPEGFQGARVTLTTVDLWVPLAQHPEMEGSGSFVDDRGRFAVQVLGRLPPGLTRSQAQAGLETVFRRLALAYPESNENRTVRVDGFGRFPAQNRVLDMVALVGVGGLMVLLLLIICGNLAGMAMARAASRDREMAVRLALGSSRWRLVRHNLAEAFVLTLTGAAVGVSMANIGMASISPADLGITAPGVTFQPGGWGLATSLALAFAAMLTFGLGPALRFSRPELVSTLKDETGGGGREVGRIHRIAVSAQAGTALALLIVGVLFFRSLTWIDGDSLGFEPAEMVMADFGSGGMFSGFLDLEREGYSTPAEGIAVVDELDRRIGAIPEVRAVALADGHPLDRRPSVGRVVPAGRPDEPEGRILVESTRVTEGFFTAIGVPVLRGREFQIQDDGSAEAVAIIDRALAERLWPGEPGLGQQFLWPAGSDEAKLRTVVGIVDHVAGSRPTDDWPQVFVPLRQAYTSRLMVILGTEADADALAPAFLEALRDVDSGLPMPRLMPGESVVARATRDQRATARLGGGLGLVVLILSAMGVYGVVGLTVTQRTREIGVRVAVGATRGRVLFTVLWDAVRLAIPGMFVGLLLASGSAVGARSMLLGLNPLDPLSFLAPGAALFLIVILASLIPGLKASGIQPVSALRVE